MRLSDEDKAALLSAARRAVREGLAGRQWRPGPGAGRLAEPGASFVTLQSGGELRGCIGSLEPRRPLLLDTALNARSAAFEDPRFEPLREEEWQGLAFHVSVLGPTRPLSAADEAALLAQLRPGQDGLVLRLGGRRATFLPSVWEQVPDPAEFLDCLRQKAGLRPGFWSPDLAFERYEVEEFS